MRLLRTAICTAWITAAGLLSFPTPSHAGEVLDDAMTLYRQGKGEEAKALLGGHLDSNPDDIDARISYWRLRQALGEGEVHRREAALFAEAHPDDPDARLIRIITLPSSQAKGKAFEEFLEQYPENSRAWEEKGRFHLEGWSPIMAVEPLNRSIGLVPDRAESYLLLALVNRALDRQEEEWSSLQKALEIRPDDEGIRFEWANTLVHHGKPAEAIPVLEELLSVFPQDPLTPGLLALACHRVGDKAREAEAKEMALQRRPSFFDGLVYQGIKLRSASQLGEAERLLTFVIDLEPEHVEAYMQLGILYRLKKEYESAVRVYATATQVEEGALNQLAWRNLGKSHQDLGDLRTAENFIRKSLEVDSDYLLGWVDLAEILGLQGKFDEATETWNRVLAMAPYGWEAAQARQVLPYLERKEIPPSGDTGKKYISPLKGMKPEDVKNRKK